MISMAKRLARPFPLILLLMFSFVAIVSSKSEQSQQQQQRQQPEAAVSEVPQSNATKSPTTSQVGSSEEVEDSSEKYDGDDDDEDSGGEEDEDDDEDGGEEDGEDSDTDEGSLAEDDEYADELKAAAGKENAKTTAKAKTQMGNDKEVSELHRRRKKTVDEGKASKDKRVPSVKKELSSQKEIFIGENETRLQLDRPVHGETLDDVPRMPDEFSKNELQETESEEEEEEKKARYGELLPMSPQYATLRSKDALKKLSKRQNSLLSDLKTYLLDERLKLQQQLGDQEGPATESLLKLLSKLAENPQRWERVHQLLTDIRADMDYSRQAIEAQKRLSQVAKPLTRREPTSTPKPTRKPKKKKKKKKKPRQRPTTTNVDSLIATTVMPWHTTLSPAAAKWRLVAERLLGPSWSTDNSGDDEVAKLRSSAPSKSRTMHRPLEDKQLENLKALNSERQALMLKAAREYSKPRTVHYGKVRTHQQSSSSEDLSNEYKSNQRSHHFGKLISPLSSSSRNDNYPPSATYSEEQPDLTPNREYPPAERDFSSGRANSAYRWPGSRTGWNWRPVAQPWLPWDTEREYYARLEQQEQQEALKAWQQAQQRQRLQNWNRHRENLPPWLEEKDLHRMMAASELWPKPDQTRPQGTTREQSEEVWGNSHNNNSELKSDDQSKSDDSKESPKLTMKTWNSLTSDPATWPFKLPGAKPWPKDENGKSYNPNAELVRKLGLYKNGRPRPDKDALKDLKQQKMPNNDKAPSKLNSWMEPDEQQTAWFNNMKLHAGFDDSSSHWNNENLSSSSSSSSSSSNNEHTWPREKIPEEWNPTKTASNSWPTKWKQFAYHKVTAQPTSDKPNKNAFIAVSAVSAPKYGNEWRKNDIEEIGQTNGSGSEDPDLPMSQMRMNMWKKSAGPNASAVHSGPTKVDVLESQLESLKQEPILLEVNVSIKNSTSHERTESSTASPNTEYIAATNK